MINTCFYPLGNASLVSCILATVKATAGIGRPPLGHSPRIFAACGGGEAFLGLGEKRAMPCQNIHSSPRMRGSGHVS